MPPSAEELTLALVLTAAGATIAGGLIMGLIELLKKLAVIGPKIDDGNEPTVAFVLSAILVLFAYVGTVSEFTLVSGFAAFLAFYGIATISMGVHGQVDTLKGE